MTRLTEIEYLADPTPLFSTWASSEWSMLLDSCRGRAERGRFDILVAAPEKVVTCEGTATTTFFDGRWERVDADPLELLQAWLRQGAMTAAGDSDYELPFTGGAVGYLAYDYGRRLERLPATVPDDTTLPLLAFGVYHWGLVTDHDREQTWLFGDPAHPGVQSTLRWLEAHRADPVPAAFSPGFEILDKVSPEISFAEYRRAFERIQDYIQSGDCYQVNFAQRFSAPARGEPWTAYRWLRQRNPAPFSAYLRLPEGAVLSSSPERFLEVRNGVVTTRPIKGTRRRGEGDVDLFAREALRGSLKDHAENVMIVDLLRNDIGRVCETGSVSVPHLFAVESYATVHHLVSTVRGQLAPGNSLIDLLRACFPGGSITGAPKVRAMEIIEELESCRRGVYCGSIGYLGFDGGMDSNIAIRTMTFEAGRLRCWAGGGIVADSDVHQEYQESLDKALAMLDVFRRGEACHVGH